jgi:hypothetical protein
MLVTELDVLQQRFPCLSLSKLVSSSCVHLSSDLITKSLESSESYPLSPARLDEITQVYNHQKSLTSVKPSNLSQEIQEDESENEKDNIRMLESIAL